MNIAVLILNDYIHETRGQKENAFFKSMGDEVTSFILNNGKQKKYWIEKGINIDATVGYTRVNNYLLKRMLHIKTIIKYTYNVSQKIKQYDLMVCHSIKALAVGIFLKLFIKKNIKIIYDAHEYETETHALSRFRKYFMKKFEKFAIKYCDKVICVADSIANAYSKDYCIDKPYLVLNTPNKKNKITNKDLFRKHFNIDKTKTIFLYQGGLERSRGILILLDTFKALDNDAVMVFMGYGELENIIRETSEKYSNIYFHDAVNPDVLLDYTSSADFGISTIEDTCLSYRYCLPNKMFEYLMAEVPVIASNLYEMKRLVENNNIGVVAKENAPKGLQEAIKQALKLDTSELKQNIQKVNEIYNWEEQEKILLKMYREMFNEKI